MLEISPNANSETVERMFRYLARRYHPDNPTTADRDRFDSVLLAHEVLKDPVKRIQYDTEYKDQLGFRSELAEQASDCDGVGRDVSIRNKLLSLFYAKRRRDVKDPGIGDIELECILGYPIELLAFNLWYMMEKKWISRTENGTFAITAEGVDHASSEIQTRTARKLLTDQS
jgi:curved DNA-binding protein CbpA